MRPLSASIACLGLIPQVLSHSFIIALDGANGVQSSGFGTRLTTRGQVHQYTGIITDKEINASTVGPCGRIFGGDDFPPFVIDPNFELSRAEASGISTVHEDGSITMGVFVHNPDGSGPFKCDFSSDASLHTFEPMNITHQVEGVDGVNPAANNYVYPLTAAFFPNATCTGGKGKDTCIVRCRNQLGFGSCAALKLGAAANRAKPSTAVQPSGNSSTAVDPAVHTTTAAPAKESNSTSGPDPAVHNTPEAARAKTSSLTDGPDPAAFEIYKAQAQPHPDPEPVINPGAPKVNGVSNAPPPHDPNYNPLTAPIPAAPAGIERRGLKAGSRPRFLHKRPRRPRTHF